MALSVMPGTDACDISINNTTKSEFIQAGDGQENSIDVCSPFCSCATCHTVAVFTFQTFKIGEAKSSFDKIQKFPLWDFGFNSNYHGNIWQPPKINA